MTIEAKAKITLTGGAEAFRQLQNVGKASQQVSKAERDAARQAVRDHQARMKAQADVAKQSAKTAQQEQRDASKSSSARQKAAQDAQRAEERAAAAVQKIQEQQTQRWQALSQKSADQRMKAEAQVTAQAQREAAKQVQLAERTAAQRAKASREGLRKVGGVFASVAGGAIAGGMGAFNTARSTAGAQSLPERIQAANDFRKRLIRATGQAGIEGDDRTKVQGQVLEASTATGTGIGDLMSVLETGQSQFNNLRFFADNLKEIATIATSAGADTGELAKALGSVQAAFGLTGEDAMKAAYLMKAAADKGAIDIKDFASAFAPSAGQFALNTKQTGLAGVRQFLGAAQGIGTGQFGGAESSTRLDRFISDLNDVDVRKKLSKIGVKRIADASGKVDVGSVLDQLGSNRKFQDAGVRQDIFADIRGREGVETLLKARSDVRRGQTGAVDFRSIAGVDEQAGRDSVANNFSALEEALQFEKEAAKMQAGVVENLKSWNDQLLTVLKASNTLEQSFGSLSLWAKDIAQTGVGALGANFLTNAIFGGAGAAAGGAAAGGGGSAVTAMAGAGAGGSLAGIALALAPFAGGFFAQQKGLDKPVEDFMSRGGIGEGIKSASKSLGLPDWAAEFNGSVGGFIGNRAADVALGAPRVGAALGRGYDWLSGGGSGGGDGAKEVVRELKEINSGLRASNAKTPPSAPREPP